MPKNEDKKDTDIQSKETSNCAAWQCIIAVPIACVLVGVIGLLAYVLVGSTGNYSTCCKINRTFIFFRILCIFLLTKYIKAYVLLYMIQETGPKENHARYRNVTVGEIYIMTYEANVHVTFCSVSTPFEKEQLDINRILIHDEKDVSGDVIT